ncbi:MAG: hypothetical protein M3552_13440 [Planctomycetota bacterium]|nr:hypothetical protein [Planctomycetaceae bacterium]MDQ3331636.1 hypothetical protein [Planctomycetota bacterium]
MSRRHDRRPDPKPNGPTRGCLVGIAVVACLAGLYGFTVSELPWYLGSDRSPNSDGRLVTLHGTDVVLVSVGLLSLSLSALFKLGPASDYKTAAAAIFALLALALMFWAPVLV